MVLEPKPPSVLSPPRAFQPVHALVAPCLDVSDSLLAHARPWPAARHQRVAVDVLLLLVPVAVDLEQHAPTRHDLSLALQVFDEIPRWLLHVLHQRYPHRGVHHRLRLVLRRLAALVAPEKYLRGSSTSVDNNNLPTRRVTKRYTIG